MHYFFARCLPAFGYQSIGVCTTERELFEWVGGWPNQSCVGADAPVVAGSVARSSAAATSRCRARPAPVWSPLWWRWWRWQVSNVTGVLDGNNNNVDFTAKYTDVLAPEVRVLLKPQRRPVRSDGLAVFCVFIISTDAPAETGNVAPTRQGGDAGVGHRLKQQVDFLFRCKPSHSVKGVAKPTKSGIGSRVAVDRAQVWWKWGDDEYLV